MLEYLKNHIIEEIGGAMDYMMKAIEHKGTTAGSKFYKMSEMEVEHANCLTHMFNSIEKPKDVTDKDYAEMHKMIMEKYADSMGKLEALKRLYWSQV